MLTLLLLVFGTGIFYILSLANTGNIFFYFSILNDVEAFTNFQYLSRYCNNITSSFQRLLVRGTDKIISRVLVVIVPLHFGPAPASQDHKDGGFGSSSSPVVYNLLLNKKLPYKRVTPNRGGNSEFSSNFFRILAAN